MGIVSTSQGVKGTVNTGVAGTRPTSTAFASVSLLTRKLVCQKDELVASVSEQIKGGTSSQGYFSFPCLGLRETSSKPVAS